MSTGPKWSRGALELINNTYVVRNNLLFEYYPISVKPYTEKDTFIRLEISPGTMSEGIAVIDDNFYDVSLQDLLRRRINVHKRRIQDDLFDSANTVTRNRRKHKEKAESSSDSNQQGFSGLFGDEIGEAADVAWEDQVQSLLQTFYTEEGEEFEITGTTQSRRSDESSAVEDILSNT